jgi:hypothetical protein
MATIGLGCAVSLLLRLYYPDVKGEGGVLVIELHASGRAHRMVMRELSRTHGPCRMVFPLTVLFLATGFAMSACRPSRPSLHDLAASAEERIRSDQKKTDPTKVPESSNPLLVVDVTLSMAGYFPPPEQKVTEFSKALDVLSGTLPGHDLYTFGNLRGRAGSSLQQLLTYQPAGFGRAFYQDELFVGQFNQDDLLFQAIGRQPSAHPLVFVTDGVYSTPQGNGIQPVVQALDALLARGWSLGIIALRSEYYGTRCELIPGRPCAAGSRLFFSEARSQRGMAQFVKMPPCAVPSRPFYVIVLAPTSKTFNELSSKLRDKLRPEASFLMASDIQPLKISPPRAFPKPEERYDSNDELKWLILDEGNQPHPEIAIDYSTSPEFPVDQFDWEVRTEHLKWRKPGFDTKWRASESGYPADIEVAHPSIGQSDESTAASSVLLWSSFDREIRDLRASFRYIYSLGEIAERHTVAIRRIESWQPAASELGSLYCDYTNQNYGFLSNERTTILRILLAVDALRRQQPGEASRQLKALGLTTAFGPQGDDLAALAKDLANFSPRRTSLASSAYLPAGDPKVFHVEAGKGDGSSTQGGGQIILTVTLPQEARTYRLHLVPRPLLMSRSLSRLTTDDDSDIAFADRTYRLGTLIAALSAAQLNRFGQRSDLTIYVTVPGR